MPDNTKESEFRRSLAHAINCASKENGSNTPDFILAQYLAGCLSAFDQATNARETYYGRGENAAAPSAI